MNVTRRRVGPTLAEEHVFREVPEGRLHHVKVAAAHAVHEGGEEVFGQSVSGRRHRVMTQRLNSDSFNQTLEYLQTAACRKRRIMQRPTLYRKHTDTFGYGEGSFGRCEIKESTHTHAPP